MYKLGSFQDNDGDIDVFIKLTPFQEFFVLTVKFQDITDKDNSYTIQDDIKLWYPISSYGLKLSDTTLKQDEDDWNDFISEFISDYIVNIIPRAILYKFECLFLDPMKNDCKTRADIDKLILNFNAILSD